MVKFVSYAGVEVKVEDVEPTTTFLQVFPQLREAFKAEKSTLFHGKDAQTKEVLKFSSRVQDHKEILVVPKPPYWKVGDQVHMFLLGDTEGRVKGRVVHVTPTGKPHVKTFPRKIIRNINYSQKHKCWQFKKESLFAPRGRNSMPMRYLQSSFAVHKV